MQIFSYLYFNTSYTSLVRIVKIRVKFFFFTMSIKIKFHKGPSFTIRSNLDKFLLSLLLLRIYNLFCFIVSQESGLSADTKVNFISVPRVSKRIIFAFNDSTSLRETFASPGRLLKCSSEIVGKMSWCKVLLDFLERPKFVSLTRWSFVRRMLLGVISQWTILCSLWRYCKAPKI